MNKRLILSAAAAATLVAAFPLLPVPARSLKASELKLNYYRVPGGEPFCGNACDGAACCTTPG
jgi:hypothetical protein